jgi:hypothetical protein
MKSIFGFLASVSGRIIRAIAGIALIAVGLAAVGGTTGIVIAAIGTVPLAAGLFDFCVFSTLVGLGFAGNQVRANTA